MEFSREFNFGLDFAGSFVECRLREHHAHFVDACIGGLVFILDVRVDVAEEELLVVLVSELQANTLSSRFSLFSKVIVDPHNS